MKRIAADPPPPTPRAPGPRPQLEVRDLELVLAAGRRGHHGGRRGGLHITQSAVSRALAQAEDRVGVRLFERSARGVSPRPPANG